MKRKLLNKLFNKEIFIVLLFILLTISVIGIIGMVYAPKEVVIINGNEKVKINSYSETVGNVLDELDLGDSKDIFTIPNAGVEIKSGMEIYIFKTIPVKLYFDGKETIVDVPIVDPEYILQTQGIELDKDDKINTNLLGNNLDKEILEPYYIEVVRVTTDIIEREVDVKYNSVLKPNYDLYRGDRGIVRQGQKGIKKEIVEVTYENGVIVAEKIIEEKIIKEPVDQVIEFGTKERLQTASRNNTIDNYRVVREMVVEATAYTHTGNTTFTGIWPYEGVVAVDPKVIPLGTKMYVEGYGYAVAADTGGLIKGNIIDVFMDTTEKAINWGRRNVKIYILE
jgi:3D (Asp-Asp-Asp) domain-containing protein